MKQNGGELWTAILLAGNNRHVTDAFDLYTVREEHDLLRESVRALVETKIAPYAAAVDSEARYPQEAHDALHAADMHAIHIPEEYGGAGADALATCLDRKSVV